jgi:hypothetical protein
MGTGTWSIPRIFHQTWRDACVPQELQRWQRSWLAHNPDFEYRFWTDEATRRFVAERYPDFLRTFDSYLPPIQRVDAARYLWMHHFGGVYADLDFECLRPLDEMLAGSDVVLGLEPPAHGGEWLREQGLKRIVGNAFLASAPGHPFWVHVIEQLLRSRDAYDPLSATGPFFLTRALAAYARPRDVTVFEWDVLYAAAKTDCWQARGDTQKLELPGTAVAVHHWVGTWWRSGALELLEETPSLPPEQTSTMVHEAPTVLIATPIKNVRGHLDRYVEGLQRLTYPRVRLSLALLESDSDDGTYEAVTALLAGLRPHFRRIQLFKRDFGFRFTGPRSAPPLQRRRREVLARSRNELLHRGLVDEDYVLWLDADVIDYPANVLETLLATGKDIVVPHCVGPDGRTFDLNTFQIVEGVEAKDREAHIVDGLLQPPKGVGRRYLEDLNDQSLVQVDGIGGTMLLVRSALHREGLIFPAFSYKLHIETEGLAVMARDMGYDCWGLPQLRIRHA